MYNHCHGVYIPIFLRKMKDLHIEDGRKEYGKDKSLFLLDCIKTM